MSSTPDEIKNDLRRHYDAMAAGVALHARHGVAELPSLERLRPAARYFYERKLASALALSGLQPPARILDVGCGYGIFTFALIDMGFAVTGVDLSPRYASLASDVSASRPRHAEGIHVADAEDLSAFDDASFDAVVSFSTVRYVPSPARALAEFRRVVRPGGRVIVDFPNRLSPWFTVIKQMTGTAPHMHDRLATPGEAVSLMTEAELRDVRRQLLLFAPKTCPTWLFRALGPIGAGMEATPGVRQLGGIIMTCGTR